MKLAIVGCRDYVNQLEFYNSLQTLFNRIDFPEWIISGGARGTDEQARLWAKEIEVNYAEFVAKWDEEGKSAGFNRNKDLVDACDYLVAFWDHKSKGTEHSINLARDQKKLIGIYNIVTQKWEFENNET